MRKLSVITMISALALLCGCSKESRGIAGGVILLVLFVLFAAFSAWQTWNYIQYYRRRIKRGRRVRFSLGLVTYVAYGLTVLFLILGIVSLAKGTQAAEPAETSQPISSSTEQIAVEPPFVAANTTETDLLNWDIRWEIFENGALRHSYERESPISFGAPEDYFALPGVSTFRGNNYRDSATYGTADVVEKRLETIWYKSTGTIAGGSWSGNGWTGQPLMVKWDDDTKQIMNLYPEKKAQANLVEVIYASLDGMIYFLDLADGSQTRDPLNIGMCFKGAGTLDPRGYPLLYVGSGDVNAAGQPPRMYIISLINGAILYEGGYDDGLSLRTDNDNWCAFDSTPLIYGETDTLIWPGESGILYTMDLNTQYDKSAGTISVHPSNQVVTRYHTGRSSSENYWCGYEAGANIVENYLYISENGGMFFCIDLNTMELVWAQDTKDDSNSTPVFERTSSDSGVLYTAPSLHWTQDSDATGTISIFKLDATSGEILWEKPYHVHTVNGVSGGVQSSPVLGKEGSALDGLIIYGIARTNTVDSGTLVALNTDTGEEVWRLDMDYYAWSSPVAVYSNDGNAYIVLCDSNGNATFVDGTTGTVLDTEYLGGLVEASPAVYNDMLVVGTRTKQICGVKIR